MSDEQTPELPQTDALQRYIELTGWIRELSAPGVGNIPSADCLDASTDTVGRSYKEGRTLDHYLAEVHAGSGTRYAPYLAEMLADRDVRGDIEMLLARGRDENYRQAYHVLKKYE